MGVVAVLAPLAIGWTYVANGRGLLIGVVGGLFYGALFMTTAVSPRAATGWSARHVLADALLFVPLVFFALLFVRPLPWWGAALGALGLGAVMVPLMVRRRRRTPAARAAQGG
jgi:hypothetical protein